MTTTLIPANELTAGDHLTDEDLTVVTVTFDPDTSRYVVVNGTAYLVPIAPVRVTRTTA